MAIWLRCYSLSSLMYVFFHSATLRNEMMMQRESLLQRINQQLGSHVIDNIIFH